MKLSILIPVFNEEKTIVSVLEKVSSLSIPDTKKEIIVINDGSTDNTDKKISDFIQKKHSVRYLFYEKNAGKGKAIQTGINEASGDYIVIQDADLEYNPEDIVRLFVPIQEGKAQVVYGTRLNRVPHITKEESRPQFLLHYFGNRFLSLLTSILYWQWITDMETCYKFFPRTALNTMQLKSRGFDFEPEITAKLLKKKYKILELPITTVPRGYKEGKKLSTFHDGCIALWSLIKYRFNN